MSNKIKSGVKASKFVPINLGQSVSIGFVKKKDYIISTISDYGLGEISLTLFPVKSTNKAVVIHFKPI